ncbi:expressed unknown protein [Seminavis robusta]|uniref:Prolyl 4-hydroxylase alpha subunit domain-containing protein n=1 Tax=Seminavis robusta TaxID=568900 RepID=A0A9N8DMA6_9STRA|nr:expressed unknown protein [Seminavis robusta]|eukprot:Sro134_g063390.1 n/a (306) ;mRNA; r:29379-30296
MVATPSAKVLPNGLEELPRRRKEASSRTTIDGACWQEHFVNAPKASLTATVGSAVAQSLSYVTIPNFGSVEERMTLQESALRLQEEQKEEQQREHQRPHVMGASQVNFNCTRYSVERLLDAPSKAVSAIFLDRLLKFLQNDKDLSRNILSTENPDDESSEFPSTTSRSTPIHQLEATWYAEPDDRGVLHPEPKVNIYQKGGYFKQHVDGMQLTLLVVLNDAFEGGGTAFYAHGDHEEEDNADTISNNNDEKEFDRWVSPPAGTAIVWGADLLHMALPVSEGMRAVYVGSFDLNEAPGHEDATITI